MFTALCSETSSPFTLITRDTRLEYKILKFNYAINGSPLEQQKSDFLSFANSR